MQRKDRKHAAEDTVASTPAITAQYASRGATSASTFSTLSTLPALVAHANPSFTSKRTRVVKGDAFAVARAMRRDGAHESSIAVLNLASDEEPGGGWLDALTETQEEALCYSSTLYATLVASAAHYPWPNTGAGCDAGLFSPGVVVWKDTLAAGLRPLPEEDVLVLGVITVAAPRNPALVGVGDEARFADEAVLDDLRKKLRLVYRMAASWGRTNLVLGAFGCGVYGCPQRVVAEEMRHVLLEDEFGGWFDRVWVARRASNGDFGPFGEIMDNVLLRDKVS